MTSFHIFKNIFNSSFEFYGLSEWLLEIMPDNVDLNRYNINRSNHGWIFRRHNARSKFICMYCTKSQSQYFKQKKRMNSWSSAYTTILFRARLDKSLNGQKIGRIQMKIFEQGCQICNMYSTGIFDEKEIKKTFYWLYIWILKIFYNVKLIDDDDFEEIYDQPQGHNRGQVPHDSSRCDGCRIGWFEINEQIIVIDELHNELRRLNDKDEQLPSPPITTSNDKQKHLIEKLHRKLYELEPERINLIFEHEHLKNEF